MKRPKTDELWLKQLDFLSWIQSTYIKDIYEPSRVLRYVFGYDELHAFFASCFKTPKVTYEYLFLEGDQRHFYTFFCGYIKCTCKNDALSIRYSMISWKSIIDN